MFSKFVKPAIISLAIILLTGIIFYIDYKDSVLSSPDAVAILHMIPFGIAFSGLNVGLLAGYYILLFISLTGLINLLSLFLKAFRSKSLKS